MFFIQPLYLLFLLALPLVWLVLRAFPPPPRRQEFPPLFLLQKLQSPPKAKQSSPLWLLLFRLFLCALLITLFAHPFFDLNQGSPLKNIKDSTRIILVIDDGFAAAANFSRIKEAAEKVLLEASRTDAGIAVIAASIAIEEEIRFENSTAARHKLDSIRPKALEPDRNKIINRISALEKGAAVVWLSDGVQSRADDKLTAKAYLYNVLEPERKKLPLIIQKVQMDMDSIKLTVLRPSREAAKVFSVEGVTAAGGRVYEQSGQFDGNELRAEVVLKPAREIRNSIAAVKLVGNVNAGAVWLMDKLDTVKAAGIISAAQGSQPFLEERYYINKALKPYVVVLEGTARDMISSAVSLLILPDSANLSAEDEQLLEKWVRQGGNLLRFSGSRLEGRVRQMITDSAVAPLPLMPFTLKPAVTYGGIATWEREQVLREFNLESPLKNIKPQGRIVIKKLLPAANVDEGVASWASLGDGNSLISTARVGLGRIILVHTAVNSAWGDFHITGAFVDVLKNILEASSGVAVPSEGYAILDQEMDGYGTLRPASDADSKPVEVARLFKSKEYLKPGYYAAGGAKLAVNMARPDLYQPLDAKDYYYESASTGYDFATPLALLVSLLLALDAVIIYLPAFIKRMQTRRSLAALFCVACLFSFRPDSAPAEVAPDAALKTSLAYAKTGDAVVDKASRLGLSHLAMELELRTSVISGKVSGVDVNADDITLYPLLYFPLNPAVRLDLDGLKKLKGFIRSGGVIVFDSASGNGFEDSPYENPGLTQILEILSLGELGKVQNDHVLLKTFYLLPELRGRFKGAVWVEKPDEAVNDGVSPVIISSFGLAEALADDNGTWLYSISGDSDKAREMALRSGVNIVLYALTGNYKGDQIHTQNLEGRVNR